MINTTTALTPYACIISLSGIDIKNVEPVLSLVPRFKGSRIARLVETSNVRKPHADVLIFDTPYCFSSYNKKTAGMLQQNIPGAFTLLCF